VAARRQGGVEGGGRRLGGGGGGNTWVRVSRVRGARFSGGPSKWRGWVRQRPATAAVRSAVEDEAA
jgi:hypothetical protein